VNFLSSAQRLHLELGRSGSGPTSITGASNANLRLFYAIADAWREIQTDPMGWAWMRRSFDVPLVSGLDSIAGVASGLVDFGRWRMPDDWYDLMAYDPTASPTQKWKVKYVPRDQFMRQYKDNPPAAAGPQYWTIGLSNEIIFSPSADKDYQIAGEYFIAPTELAIDADVPDMPSQFHMINVWKAMVQVAQFDAAPENVSRANDKYEEMLSSLMLDQGPGLTINARPLA
jgi:hypothetical protein